MVSNNITPISKEYIQVDNNRCVVMILTDLYTMNLTHENVKVVLEYKSEIYNINESGTTKTTLKQETINFKPVSFSKSQATNTTIVNATTGELIGEFDIDIKNIRDLLTKQIIGTCNLVNKTYTSNDGFEYDEEDNVINSPEPINIEGEANFVINAIKSNTIPVELMVHGMFDRIVSLGLV